jgi:hypothetical protein
MSSPKFKSHENNTLKIEMSDNYENHSEDNSKVSLHKDLLFTKLRNAFDQMSHNYSMILNDIYLKR